MRVTALGLELRIGVRVRDELDIWFRFVRYPAVFLYLAPTAAEKLQSMGCVNWIFCLFIAKSCSCRLR